MIDKATLRIFFTISGRERLYLRQADVVTAYLNADMDEEVYIKLPKICGDDSNQVRPLLKALWSPESGTTMEQQVCNFHERRGIYSIGKGQVFLL